MQPSEASENSQELTLQAQGRLVEEHGGLSYRLHFGNRGSRSSKPMVRTEDWRSLILSKNEAAADRMAEHCHDLCVM